MSETKSEKEKVVKVIGINNETNYKIIHEKIVQLGDYERITSSSVTQTRHLLITFDYTQTLLINMENFNQIKVDQQQNHHQSPYFQDKHKIFVCNDKIITTGTNLWYVESFVDYFD